MAEPTLSEQILAAVAGVQAQMTALAVSAAQRVGWSVTAIVTLNGFTIEGGFGEDDQPLPINLDAAQINLNATEGVLAAHLRSPFLAHQKISGAATLDENHNGLLIWYDGLSAANIALPTDPEDNYWFTAKCAPGAANATLTLPAGHTLDGTADPQPLIVSDVRITVTLMYAGNGEWWSV